MSLLSGQSFLRKKVLVLISKLYGVDSGRLGEACFALTSDSVNTALADLLSCFQLTLPYWTKSEDATKARWKLAGVVLLTLGTTGVRQVPVGFRCPLAYSHVALTAHGLHAVSGSTSLAETSSMLCLKRIQSASPRCLSSGSAA